MNRRKISDIVLEPRSRAVDAMVLMEQLFRLTDLESRISLNMNVLSRGQVPKVMGLSEVLTEWLGHRKTVLRRRSENRLRQIEHRLEVLGGYLVAYLNIDEVIRIIREEDEPKAQLIRRFDLSEVQAEAILNMRLRSLRKLEEIEIRAEHEKLTKEKAETGRSAGIGRKTNGGASHSRLPRRKSDSAKRPKSAAAGPTSPICPTSISMSRAPWLKKSR